MRDENCRKCALGELVRTTCLWGRQIGSPTGVMIVGDAPAYADDDSGVAFSGEPARLLFSTLKRLGLPEDYYVTTIVKCFPRGKATTTHVSACKNYLKEELEHVQPRFILALGNTAFHYFGNGAITEHAGREQWHDGYAAWVMPVLHPSAVLRDPNRRTAWESDLGRFVNLVRGSLVDKPPVDVTLCRTTKDLDRLVEYVGDATAVSFDFEATMGRWSDKTWKPYMISFSTDGKTAMVLPVLHKEQVFGASDLMGVITRLKPLMRDPKRTKVAHNQLYDSLAWYRLTGELPYVNFDTMVAAHLLDENRPKGLKYLGRALLGWSQWDIDARKEHPLERLSVYCGYDAAATLLLRNRFMSDLSDAPRLQNYFTHLSMPTVRALERLIVRGIYVNEHTVRSRIAHAESERARVALTLPINKPASTKQVAAWLYGGVPVATIPAKIITEPVPIVGLGLRAPKLTPAGAPSTDEETIKSLAQSHPQVKPLLEWRRWNKYLTTYYSPLIEQLKDSFDGRIHPEYRSTSVETGRLASSFHTTPRESMVRSVYGAPPTKILLSADYSQIEARLAAWAAAGKISDPDQIQPGTMLHAWYTGRDVYREQAAEVLSKALDQVTKDDRQMMGKVPVLAMLYRISPKGLKEYAWKKFDLDWTLAFAQHVHGSFYRRWPEFALWHEREARLVSIRGYAESAIGRLRRLPAAQMDADRNSTVVHEAQNSGINHPIQSLASDLTQVAMVLLDRMGYAIVGNVHDNLIVETTVADAPRTLGVIARTMEQAHYALRPLGLHLPPGLVGVEVTAGPWGAGRMVYASKPGDAA